MKRFGLFLLVATIVVAAFGFLTSRPVVGTTPDNEVAQSMAGSANNIFEIGKSYKVELANSVLTNVGCVAREVKGNWVRCDSTWTVQGARASGSLWFNLNYIIAIYPKTES